MADFISPHHFVYSVPISQLHIPGLFLFAAMASVHTQSLHCIVLCGFHANGL